jgi:signal transduction histidine kinase
LKWKFNFKSIKFRVWIYFLLLAGALLLLVWFLQIYFLTNYYEEMKVQQTRETALTLSSYYQNGNINEVINESQKATDGDDVYVRIDRGDKTIFPPDVNIEYQKAISEIQPILEDNMSASNSNRKAVVSKTIVDPDDGTKTFVTATCIDIKKEIVLYLVSPLTPITSTVTILQNQMFMIIIIGLVLAFLLSLYLSTRISRPITSITGAARKLADGQYGTSFPVDRRQYTEIQDLSRTLDKMSKELSKTLTLQKDLLANVSHDLRTPLTMIKSYAEMIRDLSGDIPEKRNAHLDVIIEETDRLNTLVSDMLTLSRMQSGTITLDETVFDLRQAIESVLRPYRILEAQEGYSIRFTCRAEKVLVNGDEEKIKQVVSNLLTNAIKYCGADKQIFVNLYRWGRRVHCEVVDHGVGIKPEELSHIWDRYYKTSSNHARSASGSGLGLSIVKEILTMHHAKFGVESKVGKGTTFWFELSTVEEAHPREQLPKTGRIHLLRRS